MDYFAIGEKIGNFIGNLFWLAVIFLVIRYFVRKRKARRNQQDATEKLVCNLPNFTADEWLVSGDGSRAIAVDKTQMKVAVVWNGGQYRIFDGYEIKQVQYGEGGHSSFTQEGMFTEKTTVSVGNIGFTIYFYDLNFTSFSFNVGGGTNVGSQLYHHEKNVAVHWCNMIENIAIASK